MKDMLTTTLVIGLLGALLMFCGDMTLYYDKTTSGIKEASVKGSFRRRRRWRSEF